MATWHDHTIGRRSRETRHSLVEVLLPSDYPMDAFEQALCAQTDPEMFWPEKGASTQSAKDICRRCPVLLECLDWALQHGEREGVWGATSANDRKRLRGGLHPIPSSDAEDMEVA